MLKIIKNLGNSIVNMFIDEIYGNKMFVDLAKDSTDNKIHIVGYEYNFDLSIRKIKHFDLYYVPAKDEYSVKYDLITHRSLDYTKDLYEAAMKQLRNPAYFAKKVNYLKHKIKEINNAWEDFQENLPVIASAITSSHSSR